MGNLREQAELEVLSKQIRLLPQEHPERKRLVEHYNDILDDALPILEAPLPSEVELPEDEMLADYISFKRWCLDRSIHPFSDFCRTPNFIARVFVDSVKSRGCRVRASAAEVFKGEALSRIDFEVPLTWMPHPWFIPGEECLLFLNSIATCGERPRYHAMGLGNRMPIIRGPEGNYVLSFNSKRLFWRDFDYTVVEGMPRYDLVLKLGLEPVVAAILQSRR